MLDFLIVLFGLWFGTYGIVALTFKVKEVFNNAH